jgi:hypothetical protein
MLCRPCSSFIAHPCLVMGLTWAPAPTCAGLTRCTVRRENGPTGKEENSTNLPASLSSSQPALLRQTSVKSYSRFSHKISFSGIQDIINILRYGRACQGRLKESHSLGGLPYCTCTYRVQGVFGCMPPFASSHFVARHNSGGHHFVGYAC